MPLATIAIGTVVSAIPSRAPIDKVPVENSKRQERDERSDAAARYHAQPKDRRETALANQVAQVAMVRLPQWLLVRSGSVHEGALLKAADHHRRASIRRGILRRSSSPLGSICTFV